MKKNPVQFQKGFSLMDFLKRYGTETQCAEALFQARWPSGFQCQVALAVDIAVKCR